MGPARGKLCLGQTTGPRVLVGCKKQSRVQAKHHQPHASKNDGSQDPRQTRARLCFPTPHLLCKPTKQQRKAEHRFPFLGERLGLHVCVSCICEADRTHSQDTHTSDSDSSSVLTACRFNNRVHQREGEARGNERATHRKDSKRVSVKTEPRNGPHAKEQTRHECSSAIYKVLVDPHAVLRINTMESSDRWRLRVQVLDPLA